MDRKKQIIILTLAVIALIGGIYIIARSISNKDRALLPTDKPTSVDNRPDQPRDLFAPNQAAQNNNTDVMGSVSAIAEKTLTITHLQQSVVVNINGATPVTISQGSNTTIGQMADVKVGDAVKVTYDQTTKNAIVIVLVKP